jgi:hypothetical protein
VLAIGALQDLNALVVLAILVVQWFERKTWLRNGLRNCATSNSFLSFWLALRSSSRFRNPLFVEMICKWLFSEHETTIERLMVHEKRRFGAPTFWSNLARQFRNQSKMYLFDHLDFEALHLHMILGILLFCSVRVMTNCFGCQGSQVVNN